MNVEFQAQVLKYRPFDILALYDNIIQHGRLKAAACQQISVLRHVLTDGIFETGAYGVSSKSQNPTFLGQGGPSRTQSVFKCTTMLHPRFPYNAII